MKKVYIATSIPFTSSNYGYQMTTGYLQSVQALAAEEGGYELIDVFGMTTDYYDVTQHYTSDRVHPNDNTVGAIATAVCSVLTKAPFNAPEVKKATGNVIYVSSSGKLENDGTMPERAVDNIAVAAGLLREGGTIVICGRYTLEYETVLPITSGKITITGKYNNIDYNRAGACLALAGWLYFNGDYDIENLTVENSVDNAGIVCNYNSICFGENVVCTKAAGVSTNAIIVAGINVVKGPRYESMMLYGNCDITINSGKWSYVRCGNRRVNIDYPFGGIDRNAKLTVTINGGVFESTSNNSVAATGMNNADGSCSLIINGGTFYGTVYAISRAGAKGPFDMPVMAGSAALYINGGEFKAGIKA